MDLYTLTENFLADEPVENYNSAIWTERYSTAGDFQIVAPATDEVIALLAPGKFLGQRGTKEVMIIETATIEEKLVTVVGKSLVNFLNQRFLWAKNPASATVDERIADPTDTTRTPGEFISNLVYISVINTTAFATGWIDANLDWANEEIAYLTLGAVDASGADERLTAPTGPLYDAIAYVSEAEKVGISLYLDSADPIAGYSLKFKTYRGVDHTTGGAGALVRLTPEMDTLSGVKEVRSLQEFKNVVYVYYQGEISTHYADGVVGIPVGFDRRVLITDAVGAPVGHKVTAPGSWSQGGGYSYTVIGVDDITAFREQNAKDALANHNYIFAIDGETSPISDFKYGVDYGLGDLIELEGYGGSLSKARVIEYIRAQDNVGEKEYPTISVVD